MSLGCGREEEWEAHFKCQRNVQWEAVNADFIAARETAGNGGLSQVTNDNRLS